jgi:hypothetical protein
MHVAYDAQQLYVAVEAFDSEPAGIRGRLTRRDDLAADDYVRIYLDTYDDRRRAYVFSFDPLGIQADGLYSEGTAVGRDWERNIDRSWDGVPGVQRVGELVNRWYKRVSVLTVMYSRSHTTTIMTIRNI